MNGNIHLFLESMKHSDGASLQLTSGEFNPNDGFFASLKGKGTKFKEFPSHEQVLNFIQYNSEDLIEGFLGGWKHKGEFYLDVSLKFEEQKDAEIFGIDNKQIAIFDGRNKKEILLDWENKDIKPWN